jgi:hypothetical protein
MTVQNEEEQDIKKEELEAAIRDLDGSKAAGSDLIHPRLLKELPSEAVEVLLAIMNCSLRRAQVPQSWRNGEIIPLLKKGKAPDEISSYRPVCLTSCICKLMEKVLNKRIVYLLESRGLLTECQAGFRPARSVEDQLLRLSQSVDDSFQRRERTVLALLDYAKAYDKVWRDGLICKLIDMGIGRTIIRWIQSWMSNRKAWVKYDGTKGKSKTFKQGLPQGAVLSPTLFLVFINEVASVIPPRVEISMFADDIALWSADLDVDAAAARVQEACVAVSDWSRKWLMQLSVPKCEVSLFTKDSAQANLQPQITVDGSTFAFNKFPTFLGITFDRCLSFAEHTRRVIEKVRRRNRMLSAVAGTDWGYEKDLLRTTYVAMCRSVIEYGSPAWMPWISATKHGGPGKGPT